ncbi:HSP83 [Symbiodinium sp. CCMP2592]|nr:HSP83 [Symbiodinium sp. CCMP2592]
MGSRKWYDRAKKSNWCRGPRRKYCQTCGGVPWPKYDSPVNDPLEWPSYDDFCICGVLDACVVGDVLCSGVGVTEMSRDRPWGSTCCVTGNVSSTADTASCSVGLDAIQNPLLFQCDGDMEADVVQRPAGAKVLPASNNLESLACGEEGPALQDQCAICDAPLSHGRGRQLYTQMHDDICMTRAWIGTWELLDQNPKSGGIDTPSELHARGVSCMHHCVRPTSEWHFGGLESFAYQVSREPVMRNRMLRFIRKCLVKKSPWMSTTVTLRQDDYKAFYVHTGKFLEQEAHKDVTMRSKMIEIHSRHVSKCMRTDRDWADDFIFDPGGNGESRVSLPLALTSLEYGWLA